MRKFWFIFLGISGFTLASQAALDVKLEAHPSLIKDYSIAVDLIINEGGENAFRERVFSREDLHSGVIAKQISIERASALEECHFSWLLMTDPPGEKNEGLIPLFFANRQKAQVIKKKCTALRRTNTIKLSLKSLYYKELSFRVAPSALQRRSAEFGIFHIQLPEAFQFSKLLKMTSQEAALTWKARFISTEPIHFTVQQMWRLKNGATKTEEKLYDKPQITLE